MAGTNYARGRALEHKVARELRARGFMVVRSAGSHGLADLVALAPSSTTLIQCKLGPRGMSTAEIEELVGKAAQLICTAYLVWKRSPRQPVEYVLLAGPATICRADFPGIGRHCRRDAYLISRQEHRRPMDDSRTKQVQDRTVRLGSTVLTIDPQYLHREQLRLSSIDRIVWDLEDGTCTRAEALLRLQDMGIRSLVTDSGLELR
jgi:hypothetical protein